MVTRLILVQGEVGGEVDGIRDHGERLSHELSSCEIEVEIRTASAGAGGRTVRGLVRSWRELRRLGTSSAIIVQYNPFSYGRWGFAPWLPAWLFALRISRNRPTLAVMVHEPYVPMNSVRWTVMGIWQRVQLAAIRVSADVVFTSIDAWACKFRNKIPRRPTFHVPVGSNLPDARAHRTDGRKQLAADDNTLVVCAMGRNHPSWLGDYVVAAANAIAESGPGVALLTVGASVPKLSGLDPLIKVHRPGYLGAGDLASLLAASDLFLAPLIDGVSTRRGSLMAALQHGLPVVGTAGPLTDPVLRGSDSALRLTPVGNRQLFATTAVRLAGDRSALVSIGGRARQLYERNFDWPVIARTMLATLSDR